MSVIPFVPLKLARDPLARCFPRSFTLITRTVWCLCQLPYLRFGLPPRFPIATCSMSLIPFVPLKLVRAPLARCFPRSFTFYVTHPFVPLKLARDPTRSLFPSQLYLLCPSSHSLHSPKSPLT